MIDIAILIFAVALLTSTLAYRKAANARVGITAVVATVWLAGCSVGMALSGEENKDTSILFPGAPRAVVIAKLGVPDTSAKKDEKWVDSYVIHKGNEPSMGRAAAHAGLNLVSFGAWELIGTAWELGAGAEEIQRIVVYYDESEEVVDVKAVAIDKSHEIE